MLQVVVGETDNGEMDMEAYVMPNEVIDDTTPLEAFMVTLNIGKNWEQQ